MAEISRLSRLLNGVQRGVDLTANTLVVQDLKVGGLAGAGTLLTKTILDRLLTLQDGSGINSTTFHNHDDRYYTETELNSTGGAGFIGILDTGTYYAGSTVEAALQEVGADAANLRTLSGTADGAVNLGTFTGTTIADNVTIKTALQSLETYGENTRSLVENFEWQESVIDKDLTAPPGSPVTGDRYLIGLDTGASVATGAWAGQDGKIAEWNGSAWIFTTPTVGMFVAADDESTLLYQFGGTTWTAKYFEATTASTGLTKVGFDIRLDSSAAGAGLGFSAGVLSVNVDDSTLEINSDTLRIKDLGVTTAKIAADAVTDAKIRLTNNNYLRARNAANNADVNILKVNASDVIEFASFPQKSGTPSANDDLVNKSYVDGLVGSASTMTKTVVVGESFAADTTFAVRYAKSGETAGRVYKADRDATSADNFHVVGFINGGAGLSAGNNATLYMLGEITLDSGDTAFNAGDIGLPVFLTASGAFSITAPSTASHAVCQLGVVKTTTVIDIRSTQVIGIN